MPKSAKGGAFEREICKAMSLWWTKGKRDDVVSHSDIVRFWKSIEVKGANDCWMWKSAIGAGPFEYGRFWCGPYRMLPHRLALSLFMGRLVPRNMEVRHTCDHPGCCNPRHLLLGTHRDNMLDRKVRGRENFECGVDRYNHKLNNKRVRMIRRMFGVFTYTDLAMIFNVDRALVTRVVNRVQWRHVT